MSNYSRLRNKYPALPAEPSEALSAYATAVANRDKAVQVHEDRLSEITILLETEQSGIPAEDPNADRLRAAAIERARLATDQENAEHSDALDARNQDIETAFTRLSEAEAGIVAGGAPPLQADASAEKKINDYLATLDETTKELLVDLNNQSAATSIDIAIGYIAKARYLKIPAHLSEKIFGLWDTQPRSLTYENGLTSLELVAVAATNLSCFKDVAGAEFFSLLRAQICSILGAPRGIAQSKVRFHEVEVVEAVTESAEIKRITDWMRTNAPAVRNLRYFALNFICLTNHVILTLRSHWKNDPQFTSLWANGFKGCLLDTLLASFNHDKGVLLHDIIHPWGLWVLYQAHKNFAARDICDNSMKLRFEGAACGTAAYTGAAALLDQMRATKLFDRFFNTRSQEIEDVRRVSKDIKQNRDAYCLNHRFYGHAGVKVLPTSQVAAIAPVLMAYRDVFLKNTSFKDVKAIARIAENSDGVRKVLVEKMKNLIKAEATRIEDII